MLESRIFKITEGEVDSKNPKIEVEFFWLSGKDPNTFHSCDPQPRFPGSGSKTESKAWESSDYKESAEEIIRRRKPESKFTRNSFLVAIAAVVFFHGIQDPVAIMMKININPMYLSFPLGLPREFDA